MSKKPFTIPVVIDPAILLKLNDIQQAVKANYEAIAELKKIKQFTGLAISVDPNEEVG